jgi:hypothetical protein
MLSQIKIISFFQLWDFFLLPWWMVAITVYFIYLNLILVSTDPIWTSLVYVDVVQLLPVH